MEEIKEFEIGEYIRTKQGDIIKIAQFLKLKNIYSIVGEDGVLYGNPFKVVKKHSKNIIDLIETGDYVNGYKVVNDNLESKEYGKCVDVYCPSQNLKLEFLEHVFKEQIKSIVTKEKFESECYKVEEGQDV